jgi:hypothetical protein
VVLKDAVRARVLDGEHGFVDLSLYDVGTPARLQAISRRAHLCELFADGIDDLGDVARQAGMP